MSATTARASDLELLHRVRQGEHALFADLWDRYQGWAHHVARAVTSRFDAEDIVQEAFAKVFIALRNGNGPTQGFAHYLRTAIRNVAATWGARDARLRLVPLSDDTAEGIAGRAYVFELRDLGDLEAPFRGLPERWQRILFLTCVHEVPLSLAAEAMGMTTGAATALAARAREGLRAALATTRDELRLAA